MAGHAQGRGHRHAAPGRGDAELVAQVEHDRVGRVADRADDRVGSDRAAFGKMHLGQGDLAHMGVEPHLDPAPLQHAEGVAPQIRPDLGEQPAVAVDEHDAGLRGGQVG